MDKNNWKIFSKEIRGYARKVWREKVESIGSLENRQIFLKEICDLPVFSEHRNYFPISVHYTNKTSSESNPPTVTSSYSNKALNFFKNLSNIRVNTNTHTADEMYSYILQTELDIEENRKKNEKADGYAYIGVIPRN